MDESIRVQPAINMTQLVTPEMKKPKFFDFSNKSHNYVKTCSRNSNLLSEYKRHFDSKFE